MPLESSPILASYREVRFDGKRHFELHADSIRVHGSATLQSEFDTTIAFAEIQPRIVRRRVRSNIFWGGVWLAFGGFLTTVILVEGFELDPFGVAPFLTAIIGFAGVALGVATLRKVDFAQFESKAGVAVLDVAKAGPDRSSYDEFVDKIMERVQACQSGA